MRPRAAAVLPLLAVWGLAALACGRGPDRELLETDLLARLDDSFEDGLFRIERFRRMGSAPFAPRDGGAEGLLVYYDAELALERDYTLTAWRGLNLGTLAFVLGATESGIRGFDPRGNAAGDVLRVHGRLLYRKEDGDWVRANDRPPPARPAAAPQLRGSGPVAMLARIRELLARSPDVERGTRDAVIVGELRRAVSRIDLGVAPLSGKHTFGAGPKPGTYHAFGVAFSEFATREGLPLYSYASNGSLENGQRLHAGTLDLALMQSDVAESLFLGSPEEGIFPSRGLRAVASLWPEAMHLVTLEGSGIRSLADLRGRRVAIGERGSGSRFNAAQIGAAAGLQNGRTPEIREVGLVEGLARLETGEVDALFVTEAVPSRALQGFAARRDDAHFVSLDTDVVERLAKTDFAYYPLTIEARTYPGQDAPVRTLALACALMTDLRAEDALIERVLALLVDGVADLSRRYFRAGFVSPATMRLGMAVPLHPAADRFYAALAARDEVAGEEATQADAPATPLRP